VASIIDNTAAGCIVIDPVIEVQVVILGGCPQGAQAHIIRRDDAVLQFQGGASFNVKPSRRRGLACQW